MKTLAVISIKGGSGKSTISSALAGFFARGGRSVALLDFDSQGSLEDWSQARGGHEHEVATMKLPPSDAEEALSRLGEAGADICICDTSPRATGSQMQIAKLADLILIPCRTTRFDVKGLAQTHEILRHLPGALDKARLVINQASTHLSGKTQVWQTADFVKEMYGIPMIASIGLRAAWQQAANMGVDVGELEPGGKADKELSRLAKAIVKELGDE